MALAGLLAGGARHGTSRSEHQRIVMVGAGAAGIGIARLHPHRPRARGAEGRRPAARPGPRGRRRPAWWTPTIEYRRGPRLAGARSPRRCGLGRGPRRDLARRGAGPPAHRPHRRLRRARASSRRRWCARWRAHVERPLIFPLSNPTSQRRGHARRPARVDRAAGPSWPRAAPSARSSSSGRTVRIGQGNNAFVFPGVGLGALVAEAREVTDAMFAAAAEALARRGRRTPTSPRARSTRRWAGCAQVTARWREAVVREARDRGLGPALHRRRDPAPRCAAAMWEPDYPELVPA